MEGWGSVLVRWGWGGPVGWDRDWGWEISSGVAMRKIISIAAPRKSNCLEKNSAIEKNVTYASRVL
jgi:hypothetical protein